MDAAKIAGLLRLVARELEKVGDADLSDIDVIIRIKRKTINVPAVDAKNFQPRRRRPAEKSAELPLNIAEIVDRLRNAPSRDVGFAVLHERTLSRMELTELAHAISVHVTKDDNIQKIKEKIVQSTIGARLNSLAIRGS